MKILKVIKNPYKIFVHLAYKGYFSNMRDDKYLKKMYRGAMGKKMNLESPKTFNEKLQWLKLYNRKHEYTMMVDKYLVRDYIAKKIGEEYLIPLIGVWDDPDEIDFEKLPDRFVLKCNHNSGLGMYICKDKSKMDVQWIKNELRKGLNQDYYLTGREWPYKDVPRKIIAEQFMEEASGSDLKDYKFFCFNGEPKMILVCADRFSKDGLRENFYDMKWNLMPVQRPKHPNTSYKIPMPKKLSEMTELARVLTKDISFSRIDFYEINGKIYFGEITFFPASGFEPFFPKEWDYTLGDWIQLPKKTNG